MTQVTFTPAFDGDEYHNIEVHFRTAGTQDVSEQMAQYLTQTFPERFSLTKDDKQEKPVQREGATAKSSKTTKK